jgi:CubicO group peptidase (beta-lactamase class C family)
MPGGSGRSAEVHYLPSRDSNHITINGVEAAAGVSIQGTPVKSPVHRFLFSLLLFTAAPTWTHNQAITIAESAPSFTIDGDLSDWKGSGLTPHAMTTTNSENSNGVFWVAYAPANDILYVAAEIHDDDVVLESPKAGAGIDTFELFIEADHNTSPYQPAYFRYGESMNAWRAVHRDAAQAARRIEGSTISYEWKIDLKSLRLTSSATAQASVIGFDLDYMDRDRSGVETTLYWGPGRHKPEATEELGDLILQPGREPLAELDGKAEWRDRRDLTPTHVHIRQSGNPQFLLRVPVAKSGAYHVQLPRGRYEIRAWDERTLERLNPARTVKIAGNTRAPTVQATTMNLPPRKFLPELMDYYRVPAVAFAVLDHGKPVREEVYGHDAHGNPASAATLFRVASLTKPITTMTVLRLVDQNLWNLDTPLSEYWTDPDIADDARHAELTSRMALRHRTGLPNWRSGRLAFLTDPDQEWSYSGEGFQYMRRAVEMKLGKSLDELAHAHVFAPAGMTDTSYVWTDWIEPRYAGEFYRLGEMLDYSRPTKPNAAAGLVTTIGDYARFGAWVMNGALTPGTYREMITTRPGPPFGFAQGLGWIVGRDKRGRMILNHGGSQSGMRTQIILLPDSGSGLVVFTNGSNGGPIIRAILNATLNRDGSLEIVDSMLPTWTQGSGL